MHWMLRLMNSSQKRLVFLSVTNSDIGTLYIVQHELLKEKDIDFAGLIIEASTN